MTDGLPAATRDLGAAMAEVGEPWMIIGGIAVISHGVPRATIDVDATVLAVRTNAGALLGALARHGLTPRIPGAEGFAAEHQVLLVTHRASGVPVDVTLALMPFEEEALGRAEWRNFPGVTIPVIGLDDLIIYKLVASRPLDLDDVARLLDAHGKAVGRARITDAIAGFCELLEDTSRTDTWARLQLEHPPN